MAAATKSLNSLLKKGVKFIFTPQHKKVVQALSDQSARPDVLAFPDFSAAIAGDRPFQLIRCVRGWARSCCGAKEQADGTTRPICFLSRSRLPHERNWSATELERAGGSLGGEEKPSVILWHTFCRGKRSPIAEKPLESSIGGKPSATFVFLGTYNYKLVYRSGLNGNADLLSCLSLPANDAATDADLRLTDPNDVAVYFIGASGVQPRLGKRMGTILAGLQQRPADFFAV